ncbi:MAG: AMP-binding protein, partial [Haliscomenobacter sp.]|nr:AMP-binding protein [Haliscomenobacter sp.]
MLHTERDWTAKWALYRPDHIAVKEWETGRTLTYEQLNRLANRLSWHLTRHISIKTGDRIAVLAENCLEYLLLFAAAQKTGAILVPLNYRLTSSEIDYQLENTAPSLVLWEAKYHETIQGCPFFRSIGHAWTMEDLQEFSDPGRRETEESHFPIPLLDEDHPVFILFTSGTTGFPKGALYTHKMLFWNSINTAMSLIVNTESRTVNCMPPFHTGGWNVLTTPFLHHGGYVCLMKKFDAEDMLRALVEEKPTLFMGVPTMLKMIAESAAFAEADLSSMYYLIVGGEPMPIPLIETWHEKGVYVRQGFGMTEVG